MVDFLSLYFDTIKLHHGLASVKLRRVSLCGPIKQLSGVKCQTCVENVMSINMLCPDEINQ